MTNLAFVMLPMALKSSHLIRLPRCSAENPRAKMPIGYCGLLLETLWMIFKGNLSPGSVTLDNVRKIGGSPIHSAERHADSEIWEHKEVHEWVEQMMN